MVSGEQCLSATVAVKWWRMRGGTNSGIRRKRRGRRERRVEMSGRI